MACTWPEGWLTTLAASLPHLTQRLPHLLRLKRRAFAAECLTSGLFSPANKQHQKHSVTAAAI